MIPPILECLEEGRQEFTWKELCYGVVAASTVYRWRARVAAGLAPVEKAGPKKEQLPTGADLQERIRQLDHGPRRTAGTTELQAQWSSYIGRRRFRELVEEVRQNLRDSLCRIQWHQPGTVWSLDTTDYGPEKMKITAIRDLASKYVFEPWVADRENGEQIAAHLDRLFREQGAPMFLKRDGGSPLNCGAVNEVLEAHLVLPLNSPPGYPRYNGAMERGIQDLKDVLDAQGLAGQPLGLRARLAVHDINHRPGRGARPLNPCLSFHDPALRVRLTRPERDRIFREVFGRFWELAQCLPARTRTTLTAGWRLIVEDWLVCQKWVTFRQNQQQPVSTHSEPVCSHN